MAATHVRKLQKDGSVADCFKGELLQHFSRTGDDTEGELTMKDDPCVKIKYKVKDENVAFEIVKSPRLFSENDRKQGMKNLFG